MPLSEEFWKGERERLFNVLFPLVTDAALTGAENAITDLGVGVDWELVNKAVKKWAKKYTFDLVGGINETSKTFLQKAVSEWIESGQPLDDLIEDIESMFSTNRAEMISITEVTRAFAEGNIASWKASEVVDGKKWMTAQDELVCEICEPLAGVESSLDEDAPPAHVRCRCWVSPVVKI